MISPWGFSTGGRNVFMFTVETTLVYLVSKSTKKSCEAFAGPVQLRRLLPAQNQGSTIVTRTCASPLIACHGTTRQAKLVILDFLAPSALPIGVAVVFPPP